LNLPCKQKACDSLKGRNESKSNTRTIGQCVGYIPAPSRQTLVVAVNQFTTLLAPSLQATNMQHSLKGKVYSRRLPRRRQRKTWALPSPTTAVSHLELALSWFQVRTSSWPSWSRRKKGGPASACRPCCRTCAHKTPTSLLLPSLVTVLSSAALPSSSTVLKLPIVATASTRGRSDLPSISTPRRNMASYWAESRTRTFRTRAAGRPGTPPRRSRRS